MDTEERALLAAIVAHPEEDTPRLVYADWLDENADALPAARRAPARARAELIRAQVERGALVFGARGFEKRDQEIGWLVSEVESDFKRVWVRELPAAARRRGARFELDRGFVGEVECSVKFFVEAGAALLGAAPVTAARLEGLARRNVRKLASCPHFSKLRTLKIYVDDTDHDDILALLETAPVSQLTALHLDNRMIDYTEEGREARTDALVVRLAGLTRLAGLKRLMLDAAAVGAEGGAALAASPHLSGLELLDLRENPALGAAQKALRKRFGKRVWLEYKDRKGFPARYIHHFELPGG